MIQNILSHKNNIYFSEWRAFYHFLVDDAKSKALSEESQS